MARRERLESRSSSHAVAASLSVTLHIGMFLAIVLSGGRQDGVDKEDTPVAQLVMIESPKAMRRDGSDEGQLKLATLAPALRVPLHLGTVDAPTLPAPEPVADLDEAIGAPRIDVPAPSDIATTSAVEPQSTFVMPQAQASALLQRIERLARKTLTANSRANVTWTQDGKRYDAELVLERATNGSELDRVVAEISAEDRGKRHWARVMLKQLSFSQFAQIIDRWDPTVQLHDDEVVGPMHFNSQFNVLGDSRARPTLLGKVSTSASSFTLRSADRTRESDVFREGIETSAGRIALPERVRPVEWALRDSNARIHQFTNDTRIRFFPDGSYWWRDSTSDTPHYTRDVPGHPVYFIAARGVTLFVQGIVAGKVLVYSPERIVVEGSLTYAHDPRAAADSDDYLGLVCDRNIELASPVVTGPGDIDIHAAVYAKRRFVITDLDHEPSATLRIYGSLAAGSMTASEPRYATLIEFDRRFEQQRPPGFPSVDQFVAEDWDRQWTELPAQAASMNADASM